MTLLGGIKSKITKDEKGENVSRLEITLVVLIHRNVVNTSYQQNSWVLYTFSPNKSFEQLLDIWPENVIFLKTFDSEFFYIEAWFTDQNSKPLEIKNKIKITLVVNQSVKYKNWLDTQFNKETEYLLKVMNFCLLLKKWVKMLAKI